MVEHREINLIMAGGIGNCDCPFCEVANVLGDMSVSGKQKKRDFLRDLKNGRGIENVFIVRRKMQLYVLHR